ncbi:MAG: lytic transglycosylase domain-containing protein [Acidobacteriales bacterium]|nr:lytic transglycosylase domain-containing protein [Terriglobales bacterium]
MMALIGVAVATAGSPTGRVTSVVRTNKRTGKLVRTVVVTPPADAGNTTEADSARHDLRSIVQDAASRHDVDPLLVDSVIQAESGYNALAVSNKGAEGLMQLIPATARRFGVKNTFDPRENIEGGVRYLKYLKEAFKDERLALAAYNAGEGAVVKYGWIPPYRETRDYVQKVGKRYSEARKVSAAAPPASKPPSAAPEQPQYRSIEQFVDAEGRLHIRTR